MKVVLSGAERGASRKLLLANEVKALGVNVSQLHIPKRKALDLTELYDGAEIYVYTSDTDEDVERFDSFLREHHEAIHTVIGRPDYDGKWLGDKYVPLWNDAEDLERLAYLCERHHSVAVSDNALDKMVLNRIKQFADRWGTKMIVMSSKVDFITAFDWDIIIVAHWTSVMKYGETQVWDGRTLKRYSRQQKTSSRANHRADIERLGVDPDEVMADDSDAVATLAIRSWLSLEMAQNGAYTVDSGPSTGGDIDLNNRPEGDGSNYDTPEVTPTSSSSGLPVVANTSPERRNEEDQALLPFLALEQRDFDDDESEESHTDQGDRPRSSKVQIARRDQTLRQCDSCYLSSRCPEYRGGFECAYRFPVRLETMDQMRRMVNLLLEMQVERAMFGAFAEQLEGQGVDQTVSKEFDRVFKMVEAIKALDDDRDIFSLKVEARSGAGVLDRIFGSKVTQQMTPLEQQVDTNRVINELGIVDAEVVQDEQD